jgi:hypothetical protein
VARYAEPAATAEPLPRLVAENLMVSLLGGLLAGQGNYQGCMGLCEARRVVWCLALQLTVAFLHCQVEIGAGLTYWGSVLSACRGEVLWVWYSDIPEPRCVAATIWRNFF